MSPSPVDRAIALAGQGFRVFPVKGKRPLPGSRGFTDASDNPAVIAAMPWHLANAVGIACGGDDARLLVLDLDTDKSGATPLGQSLALGRLNLLPLTTHTRRVRTPSGGVHLYIRIGFDSLPLPASRADVLVTKSKDGVALDIRCAGGYVVAYVAQTECDFPLVALPVIDRSILEAAGIVPPPKGVQLTRTGRVGVKSSARGSGMGRNSLADWRRVALEAVKAGGIPLDGNEAFLRFAGALASAVRDEGHALNDVLAIFHDIASQFPNYEAHREEARFLSFTRPDYTGPRPGFGTLVYHADAARLVQLRSVPLTPALPARGAVR